MSWPRIIITSLIILTLFSTQDYSQTTGGTDSSSAASEWTFSASAYTYFVPHSEAYINPNFTADRHRLHLEARYNYEAKETTSAWVGYKFSHGEKLAIEVTPMVGAVFGKLKGIAPGYLAAVTYKRLDVSSQGEFVVATERADRFFYTWTEVGYSPAAWFRGGFVVQRTKAYQTPFDIQRGLFAGVTYKKLDFVTYVFNLGKSEKTLVGAVVMNF